MAHDHDILVLNDLITTTIDSADGFERAAEDAQSGRFSARFREFAAERRRAVAMLQDKVRGFGGTPNDDGSLTAGLHRRWLDLKAAITQNDVGDARDRAVIQEVERGEDWLKGKYDAALDDIALSKEALDAIGDAYRSVRAGHDTASRLKHELEGSPA